MPCGEDCGGDGLAGAAPVVVPGEVFARGVTSRMPGGGCGGRLALRHGRRLGLRLVHAGIVQAVEHGAQHQRDGECKQRDLPAGSRTFLKRRIGLQLGVEARPRAETVITQA